MSNNKRNNNSKVKIDELSAISSSDKPVEIKVKEQKEETKLCAPSVKVKIQGKDYDAYPYTTDEDMQSLQGWRLPYYVEIDNEKYVMDLLPYSIGKDKLYSAKIDLEMTDIYTLEAEYQKTFKPVYKIVSPYTFEPTDKDRAGVAKFVESLWAQKIYPVFTVENFAAINDDIKIVLIRQLIENGRDRSDFNRESIDEQSINEYIKYRISKSRKSLEDSLKRIGYKKTIDLEKETEKNRFYRRVIYTGQNSQLVLMHLQEGENIPEESHIGEQFIRVEKGHLLVEFSPEDRGVVSSAVVKSGQSIIIPFNQRHKVTAVKETFLYSVYSFNIGKTIHNPGTVHRDASEAKRAESRKEMTQPKIKGVVEDDEEDILNILDRRNVNTEEQVLSDGEEEDGYTSP